MRRSILYIKQILAWADTHHEQTGKWPEADSGRVRGALDEKWANIDGALRGGFRALPRGGSLARLLAEHRGKRNRKALPKYTIRQILQWADEHHAQHGSWPLSSSGPIAGTNGETWLAVEIALLHGRRGLSGGSSLPKLLAAKRGVPNRLDVPRLSIPQILAWADAHYRRTGDWPTADSGPVEPNSTETWSKVDNALKAACRGLRRRQSLFKVLARHRKLYQHIRKPRLTIDEILRWADAHRARTGQWPKNRSGSIPESDGETWYRVEGALLDGRRGLPGGMTLTRLLAEHRGVRT
jgi:hypothetical protein